MKAFITPTYTFTPGASGVGTVDLSNIPSFDIRRLIAIINQTDGVIIYTTASEEKKHTAEASGVVTLFFDTSTMDAGDDLQIVYDSADEPATQATLAAMSAKLPATLAQKSSANSFGVVLSTEQEAILSLINTKLDSVIAGAASGNAFGGQEGIVGTSQIIVAPPTGAYAFILQGKPGNSAIRWSLNAASTTDGHVLEDSRDTGVIPVASSVCICGQEANQGYVLTWLKRV